MCAAGHPSPRHLLRASAASYSPRWRCHLPTPPVPPLGAANLPQLLCRRARARASASPRALSRHLEPPPLAVLSLNTRTLTGALTGLQASDRMADDVLGQAQAAQHALSSQRAGFDDTNSKLKLISTLAPRVNSLLGAIGRRQKRDKMILAVVTGLCIGFILIYAFG